MYLPFPLDVWAQNSQVQSSYNPYIHSGRDLQCSTTKPHRAEHWENTLEEPKWLSEKSTHDITNYDYALYSRRLRSKNLEATILFVDFPLAFDSKHRRMLEQTFLAYSLLKETVAAIMMLYKNTIAKVRSPDRNTDFFNIVAGVHKERH